MPRLLIIILFLYSCKKDLKLTISSNYPTTITINKTSKQTDFLEMELNGKTNITTSDSCHFTIKENGVIIWNEFTNELNFKSRNKLEN